MPPTSTKQQTLFNSMGCYKLSSNAENYGNKLELL